MRKELIIAVIVGVLMGATIAFGVWRANWALKNNKAKPAETSQVDNGNEIPNKNPTNISLASPEQYSVITQNTTKVSGITSQNSLIVISAEVEDYIIKSEDGSFEQEIGLIGGVNQIVVSKIGLDESLTSSILTVVYSSEFKSTDQEDSEESDNKTSTGSDQIREKVREKIESIKNNPKAYIGTVTDKTKDTLQLKIPSGEIRLISVDSEKTAFVKTGKTNTSVKFDDLAIGDFVIAMGFLENITDNGDKISNLVLNTQRVIITSPLSDPTREITFGQVNKTVKNSLILIDKEGNERIFTFPKKWKGPEIKEFKEGEKVVAVVEQEENIYKIRTIEITSKIKASSN